MGQCRCSRLVTLGAGYLPGSCKQGPTPAFCVSTIQSSRLVHNSSYVFQPAYTHLLFDPSSRVTAGRASTTLTFTLGGMLPAGHARACGRSMPWHAVVHAHARARAVGGFAVGARFLRAHRIIRRRPFLMVHTNAPSRVLHKTRGPGPMPPTQHCCISQELDLHIQLRHQPPAHDSDSRPLLKVPGTWFLLVVCFGCDAAYPASPPLCQ